jgi:hypothetical protein
MIVEARGWGTAKVKGENEEFDKMKNRPGENWFRMEAFGSLSFGCVGPG